MVRRTLTGEQRMHAAASHLGERAAGGQVATGKDAEVEKRRI
jgi:hypothetical protein